MSAPVHDAHRVLVNWVFVVNGKGIQNCINAHAEEVGCHYVDKAQRWRWEAWRLAQDQIKGAGHE